MNISRLLRLVFCVFGITLFSSCTPSKFLWFTSSGIMTYNRNTGQFEVLWENNGGGHPEKCDTVYVYTNGNCPADSVPQ